MEELTVTPRVVASGSPAQRFRQLMNVNEAISALIGAIAVSLTPLIAY